MIVVSWVVVGLTRLWFLGLLVVRDLSVLLVGLLSDVLFGVYVVFCGVLVGAVYCCGCGSLRARCCDCIWMVAVGWGVI